MRSDNWNTSAILFTILLNSSPLVSWWVMNEAERVKWIFEHAHPILILILQRDLNSILSTEIEISFCVRMQTNLNVTKIHRNGNICDYRHNSLHLRLLFHVRSSIFAIRGHLFCSESHYSNDMMNWMPFIQFWWQRDYNSYSHSQPSIIIYFVSAHELWIEI